jgi:hypothetical protein
MKAFLFVSPVFMSAVSALAQITPPPISPPPISPVTVTQHYDTGIVGIAPGQTAKFNVLYPSIPAPLLAIQCSATLLISDAQGNVLKTLAVPQLLAGNSASLTLDADTDLPGGSGRVEIQARAITPQPGSTSGPCTLVPTLELVDNPTGKTTVVVKGGLTWPSQAQVTATQPVPVATGNPGN